MTGGCADGSLLMHAQTNGHHLHSYVLLFLCLNKKNYHVVIPDRIRNLIFKNCRMRYFITDIYAYVKIKCLVLVNNDIIGTILVLYSF